jgi:hypothetical protein
VRPCYKGWPDSQVLPSPSRTLGRHHQGERRGKQLGSAGRGQKDGQRSPGSDSGQRQEGAAGAGTHLSNGSQMTGVQGRGGKAGQEGSVRVTGGALAVHGGPEKLWR